MKRKPSESQQLEATSAELCEATDSEWSEFVRRAGHALSPAPSTKLVDVNPEMVAAISILCASDSEQMSDFQKMWARSPERRAMFEEAQKHLTIAGNILIQLGTGNMVNS